MKKGNYFPTLPVLHSFFRFSISTCTLYSSAALTDMHLSQLDNQTIVEGTSSWHVCKPLGPMLQVVIEKQIITKVP